MCDLLTSGQQNKANCSRTGTNIREGFRICGNMEEGEGNGGGGGSGD